jgi:hypothetical protein
MSLTAVKATLTLRGNMRCFKVGGIRFLRIGRLQFSFCLCRRRQSASRCEIEPLPAPFRFLLALGFVQALTCVALYVAH